MFDAQRVRERLPLENALPISHLLPLRILRFELESVDNVVEEVGLADCDTREGNVGEVDLRECRGQ
jgi:hypothetical protein